MLRNGDFSPAALHSLLREYLALRNKDERNELEGENSAHAQQLKQAAHRARAEYRSGSILRRKIDDKTLLDENLSSQQKEQLADFDSGKLLERKMSANQDFGHGAGAEERLTNEQLITIASTTQALPAYFAA